MGKMTMVETLRAQNRVISAMEKMLFDMRRANERMIGKLNRGEITPGSELLNVEQRDVVRVSGAVIGRLNEKAGRSFDPTAGATLQLIRNRMEDGYGERELLAVVDDRYRQWVGTDFEQYLRPQTLFSDKNFESYLVEATAKGRASALDELAQSMALGIQG